MALIARFINSWVRAYGTEDQQKALLGRACRSGPVCVERLPEGGVYVVDRAASGAEIRERDHWGRKLACARKRLVGGPAPPGA